MEQTGAGALRRGWQHVPHKRLSSLPAAGAGGRRGEAGRAGCPQRRRRRRSLRRRPGARSENVSVPLLLLLRLPLCRAALSREGPPPLPPPRSMGSCWLRLAALLALGACPSLEYDGREGRERRKGAGEPPAAGEPFSSRQAARRGRGGGGGWLRPGGASRHGGGGETGVLAARSPPGALCVVLRLVLPLARQLKGSLRDD